MTSALQVYLRNHEAAARAGRDLFERVARAQRRRPYGAELALLRDEVAEDLASLQELMARWDTEPDRFLGLALQFGERLGRLKPNGGFVRRSPLSDLVEIEALVDAVHAKLAGWHALGGVGLPGQDRIDTLAERAENQRQRLWELHAQASSVLVR